MRIEIVKDKVVGFQVRVVNDDGQIADWICKRVTYDANQDTAQLLRRRRGFAGAQGQLRDRA
jgi:hypothetical protein